MGVRHAEKIEDAGREVLDDLLQALRSVVESWRQWKDDGPGAQGAGHIVDPGAAGARPADRGRGGVGALVLVGFGSGPSAIRVESWDTVGVKRLLPGGCADRDGTAAV